MSAPRSVVRDLRSLLACGTLLALAFGGGCGGERGGGGPGPGGDGNGGAGELVAVAFPDTAPMSPQVREQITARRAAVDAFGPAGPGPGAAAAGGTGRAEAGRAWGELGRVYHAYGFHAAAEGCYRNARALDPSTARWAYLLGYLLQTTGHQQESAAMLAEARRLGLDSLAVWVRQGTVFHDLGRTAEAAEAFRQAIARDPECAAAHYGAGRAAAAAGDQAAARDHFLRALELAPGEGVIHLALGATYRALGETDLAREELRRGSPGMVGFPDEEKGAIEELARGVTARLAAGTYRAGAGDFAGAAAEFRRAVEADPADFQARLALGSALTSLGGHAEEARRELAEAVRLAPDDPSVASAAGLHLATLGDLDEAVRLERRAVELAPDYEEARLRLGQILARRGEPAAAVEQYTAALAIDPQAIDARYGRGLALAALGRGGEAEADFRAVLAARPGHAGARGELAALYQGRGDPEGAVRVLREGLDAQTEMADRDRAWLSARLGTLLARGGDHAEAAERFGRAVELEPDFLDARFNLAVSLQRLGRHAEAAAEFHRVALADPARPAARSGEAAALQLAGRYREARAALADGLAAAPGDPMLGADLARLLATCPDPALRDGPGAVALAERLFSADRSLEHAELVAMAYAAADRFDEAMEWQRQVIAGAERAGQRAALPLLEANLERYRRGEVCCAG